MKKKSIKIIKPAPLPYTLRDLLDFYPVSVKAAFDASGVHRTTWQRWISGETKPPRSTLLLIRMIALGALPDPAFHGFTCHSGLIWDETNTGFTPGDIRSIPFFRAGQAKYVSALKRITELESKILAIESNSNMLESPGENSTMKVIK